MKNKLLLFFLLFTLNGFGQRHDNVWPLGTQYGINSIFYYNLDFSNGNADTVSYQRKMNFYSSNATASDSTGYIQFYTNGIWIANTQNDTMLYSQNFNPGYLYYYYFSTGIGVNQNAIILPFTDGSSKYYLIHESGEYFINKDSVTDIQPFNLMYTIIDMLGDNGKGAVDTNSKGVIAISDTLLQGRITACKHANGRDWWVIKHQYYSDIYYKLLFTPYGVYGPYTQHIGAICYPKYSVNSDFDVYGMSCFSPDGTKFIMYSANNQIELFDFDRCTGIFSNYISTFSPDTTTEGVACSFSANSRYLYINNYLNSYQYDTYSSNFSSSAINIATYDGYVAPNPAWFFLNQLGPDGKIYVSARNFPRILHVIENPDSAGITSNFNQHSYSLPLNYGGNSSLPNFPNYRLGRLVGSPCDTLTNLSPGPSPQMRGVAVVPNPNDGNFVVNYSLPQNKSGTLLIVDVMGKQVHKQTLPQWSTMQRLSLPQLSKGIYLLKVVCENGVASVKFVKE